MMFSSASQIKQSYPTKQIIFIKLRLDKSTVIPKPFEKFLNKNCADRFEENLLVVRPKV